MLTKSTSGSLKLSKMQRVGQSECCQLLKGCIFGTGATHWILDRVVWERFSQSRQHSDGRHLLQIQVQRVPCVFSTDSSPLMTGPGVWLMPTQLYRTSSMWGLWQGSDGIYPGCQHIGESFLSISKALRSPSWVLEYLLHRHFI